MTLQRWTLVLFGRRPAATVMRVLVIVAASVVVFGVWLMPIRAHGPSMLPTFQPGSLKFVNKLAYSWDSPHRGDIVAIRMAGPSVVYVKRVIAVPGERVRIERGIVVVNDTPIDEPYVKYRAGWTVPEVVLGPEEYFVVGDNRGMREQQHDFGIARRERLVGKILF